MLNRFKAALDDISVWKKGIAVVSIPLVVLLMELLLTAWLQKVAQDAQSLVQHSLEVKATINEVLASTTEAENGVRGYLMWRDPIYLAPYNEGRVELMPAIDELRALVQDNSSQTSLSRALREKGILKLDSLVYLKRNPEAVTDSRNPYVQQSRVSGDDVRNILNKMRSEEDALLTRRIGEYDQVRRRVNIVLVILLVLAILCGLTASYVVSSSILFRVNNLEAYARQVSRGQPATWKDSGLDELGALGHSVKVMTASLLQREKALHEARSQLETANDSLAILLQEAQSANRELEAFSYSVSHDLRAPLRHVAGFSELMVKNSQSLDPKNQRYLNIIAASIKQMGVLIDDLLAFSRMGRTALKSDPVNLDAIINEVLTDLGPEMENRNVRWEVSPLPTVVGDHGTIRLVFQNLLGNALKYSRSRDPAIIKVEVEDAQEPGIAKVVISDNGVGFDMQFQDKLFGVFQRLHSAEEFEGTGIGLATARRIVQRHGGDVTAFAELDKGAKFSFTLPLERDQDGS